MNYTKNLKRLYKNNDKDAQLYVYGIIVAGLVAITYFVNYYIEETMNVELIKDCFIKKCLGVYCPGCFGTRSFMSLLKGDILQSFIYHPAIPMFIIIAGSFYISQTLRYCTNEKIKGIKYHNCFLILEIVLSFANCIAKNIGLGI